MLPIARCVALDAGDCADDRATHWPRRARRMRAVLGEGLGLEPQVAAHAEAMFAVLSDPAIYAFEGEPPRSVDWLRARFERLATRCSPDGTQQWLNWVIRLPDGSLAGFVQAGVTTDGRATIAYVLDSAHWGQGIARRAVEAMIAELVVRHGARQLFAVLKRANRRSMALLERLDFSPLPADAPGAPGIDDDECGMVRACDPPASGGRVQGVAGDFAGLAEQIAADSGWEVPCPKVSP
jgi:RimJ/RimL family protein N-acetyltransferase